MTTYWNKKIAVALIALVVAPSAFFLAPAKAQAQWAVIDPTNLIQNTVQALISGQLNIKEYVLDPLAHMAARQAIQSIIRSTVNWANSGFEGSPAYVTNLRQDLRRLADVEADRFLNELGISGSINSPFRDQVVAGLRGSYLRSTGSNAFFERSRYTLDQYSQNPEAFYRGDTSQGGMTAWVEAWRNDQNNIFGAFRSAREELERRVAEAVGDRVTQLSWSRGVFSWCTEPEVLAEGETSTNSGGTSSAPVAPEGVELTQGATGGSANCQVQTPGSWIHDRIERSLGSDIDSLISADEINEVIGALLSGLANKIMGGDGFAGLSRPSPGGGASPVDAAVDAGIVDPSLSNNIANIITGQVEELQRFRSSWQTIKDAAQEVYDECSNKRNRAEEIIDEADTAIAKADVALEALGEISTQIMSSDSEQIRLGQSAYETLNASGILPSGSEIARAVRESQSNENIQPMTLRTEMERAFPPLCLD